MIRMNTDAGQITVDSAVYTNIAGYAATNCFGVKVTFSPDNSISIDLHIMVDKSVNLSAIAASIISEVRYFVTKSTGTEVRAVNVFVDSMSVD